MNTRNLLIIAAVPGFRANTKLEREDNFVSKPKAPPLDIYADLALKLVATKKAPAKTLSQMAKESIFNVPRQRASELFQQEFMTRPPRDYDVDVNRQTVYYGGRWFTATEACDLEPQERRKLSDVYAGAVKQDQRRRMERAKMISSMEQPKPRLRPDDKTLRNRTSA